MNEKRAAEGPIAANYFAIIPADVRYDKRLSANEKLLYGEITCLTLSEGYCWATDKALAESFSVGGHTVNEKTVSRWVSNLKKYGHIQVQVLTKNKMVCGRRIYLKTALPNLPDKLEVDVSDSTRKNADTIPQNCGNVPAKMRKTYPQKCGTEKEKDVSKKSAPAGADMLLEELYQVLHPAESMTEELHDSVFAYAEMREAKKSKLTTKRAVKGIVKKLMDYSHGSVAGVIQVLDQSTERSYIGVFPVKSVSAPQAPQPPQNSAGELW